MFTIPIPGIIAPRLKRDLQRYASDKRGVAAVEFALIATPFFFLIFGLLEICMVFIMSSVLEHGINEAARDIRTGQAQADGFDQGAFRASVCGELFELLECDSKLQFDVRVFDSFTNTTDTSPIDGDGELDTSGFGFDMGNASEIVVVRVFYEWNLITPILSAPLANMSEGRRLLQSTVAFRNEPFGS